MIGKKIGLVRGYSYPSSVVDNKNLYIDYSGDATISMKKLILNRIDVVLDDIEVGKEAIIKTNLNNGG